MSASMLDLSKIQFKLNTPYVSMEDKLTFFQLFVNRLIYISYRGAPSLSAPKEANKESFLLNRVLNYLKTGNVSLGQVPAFFTDRKEALSELLDKLSLLNMQFNLYVKSNDEILDKIKSKLEAGQLRYQDLLKDNPVKIQEDNLVLNNKEIQSLSHPHLFNVSKGWNISPYQLAFIEKIENRFLDINAFEVGLGKTSTSLIAVQNVHNKRTKCKTVFVMPKSTLSNFYKEGYLGDSKRSPVFVSGLDAIFIGLKTEKLDKEYQDYCTKHGITYQPKPKSIDDQLLLAQSPRFSKVFMSYEDFYRIRMREDTLEVYLDALCESDCDFASALEMKKKTALGFVSRVKRNSEAIRGKSPKEVFFEDFHFDSLVVDELHAYKNSKEAFSPIRAKYLSLPSSSAKGLDAQAKAWYIREQNRQVTGKADGILGLSATPFTNSPLEIFSMFSLVTGDELFFKLTGLTGSSQFLSSTCEVTEDIDQGVDGDDREFSIFKGIKNLTILRDSIFKVVTFLTHDDVRSNIHTPLTELKAYNVIADKYQLHFIKQFKDAYNVAREVMALEMMALFGEDVSVQKAQLLSSPEGKAFELVQERYHETTEVIASPFNFIRKMERVVTDRDLNEQGLYLYCPISFQNEVQQTIDKFNHKKFIEKRVRPSFHTQPEHAEPIIDPETGNVIAFNVHINASLQIEKEECVIFIDTLDYNRQKEFYFSFSKEVLSHIYVKSSPKYDVLLTNIRAEMENPRGLTLDGPLPFTKQLIFCDHIGAHFKLELLLKQLFDSSRIAVLTGQTNSEPEEVLEIQERFNLTEGDYFQILIANEKAEVGLNLQNGTQAVHHLTIGWTPDSINQRTGRGARQGNLTEFVNVYFYDMQNTFDFYKRKLVDNKRNWIEEVTNNEGADFVEIVQGFTPSQYQALIENMGEQVDEEALAKQYEEERLRNRTKRIIEEQKMYLRFLVSGSKKIENMDVILDKVHQALQTLNERREIEKKIINLQVDHTFPSMLPVFNALRDNAIEHSHSFHSQGEKLLWTDELENEIFTHLSLPFYLRDIDYTECDKLERSFAPKRNVWDVKSLRLVDKQQDYFIHFPKELALKIADLAEKALTTFPAEDFAHTLPRSLIHDVLIVNLTSSKMSSLFYLEPFKLAFYEAFLRYKKTPESLGLLNITQNYRFKMKGLMEEWHQLNHGAEQDCKQLAQYITVHPAWLSAPMVNHQFGSHISLNKDKMMAFWGKSPTLCLMEYFNLEKANLSYIANQLPFFQNNQLISLDLDGITLRNEQILNRIGHVAVSEYQSRCEEGTLPANLAERAQKGELYFQDNEYYCEGDTFESRITLYNRAINYRGAIMPYMSNSFMLDYDDFLSAKSKTQTLSKSEHDILAYKIGYKTEQQHELNLDNALNEVGKFYQYLLELRENTNEKQVRFAILKDFAQLVNHYFTFDLQLISLTRIIHNHWISYYNVATPEEMMLESHYRLFDRELNFSITRESKEIELNKVEPSDNLYIFLALMNLYNCFICASTFGTIHKQRLEKLEDFFKKDYLEIKRPEILSKLKPLRLTILESL